MLSGSLLLTGATVAAVAVYAYFRGRLAKDRFFALLLLGVLAALAACTVDRSLQATWPAPAAASVYLLFAWWLAGGADRLPPARRLRLRYCPDPAKAAPRW